MGLRSVCMLLLLVALAASAPSRDHNSKRYKVVCYLGSWANYRGGEGKFLIENIDPNLCTHLVYGFAKLAGNQIAVYDPYLDLKENWGLGAYQRFNNLKKQNPNLSTLIAIGGWNEGSTKYSQMAADPNARATFVKSAVDFCLKYDFDGLDMDWEYPANRGGAAADKQNFVTLLKELKEAFAPHGLILSAAVSAGKNTIDTAYDIPGVSKYLDFINVMAYDLHGSWEKTTGHNAPLYERPGESEGDKILNVNYAIKYWIAKGAPKNKIILGMGTYGRSFTLANPSDNKLGAPTTGPGRAGPLTKEPGMLGYNEICRDKGFTEVFVEKVEAPYAYNGNQWVGYDNVKSIGIKVDYLIREGLGGGMIWSLETDDFRGNCGGRNVVISSSNEPENSNSPFFNPSQGSSLNEKRERINNNIYREKYRKLKRVVKDFVFENAALCDEVARMQEKILIAKEERRKLQGFQSLKDGSAPTNHVPGVSSTSGKNVAGENTESQVKKKAPVKKRPASKTVEEGAKPKPKRRKVPADKRLVTPIPLDVAGRPIFPIVLGSLTIHSLGVIVSDRPGYHTEQCIYPVGFCSSRTYASLKNPLIQCLYQCTVTDSPFGPRFEITPEDDPGHSLIGSSPNEVHSALLKSLNAVCGKEVVSVDGQGAKFFGLSHPTVQNLIQSCAGARKCSDYRWVQFEVAKVAEGEEDHITKDFDPTINFDVLLHIIKESTPVVSVNSGLLAVR
ncbi:Chitotriosidase-1 like protein [Argiope bruennichi]|uniref:Chitotriosidase-1 like protein n=1 Tax=Argiope bruennichi TaxID=94029 RepID=A0A8T0F7Q3_ARGBR|nr:Chitotriosidase-1 like protein [Argiope bruennichi]